jgi:pyrroloquinoline quinone (PQQ) biosynthesis protein C
MDLNSIRFYERRREDVAVQSADRRKMERRERDRNMVVERRRSADCRLAQGSEIGRKKNKQFSPDPAWALEMNEHLESYKEKILKCRLVQETSEGKLSLAQIQGWIVQFYPFIDNFPQYIALNLSKAETPLARSYLISNVKVEEKHAEQWRDMAKGFGISEEALFNAPILLEVEALMNWLWSVNYRASLAEGMAATNYGIEGISKNIASIMVNGFQRYHGRDETFLDKKARRWMRGHSNYNASHPLEALEIIKQQAVSIELQQRVRRAAQRSLEYLHRALEACYMAYAPECIVNLTKLGGIKIL